MTEEKPTHISAEDLAAIQSARANAAFMRALADKASAESKSAELEAKNVVLLAYVKYSLNANDIVELDGSIVRTVDKHLTDKNEDIYEDNK